MGLNLVSRKKIRYFFLLSSEILYFSLGKGKYTPDTGMAFEVEGRMR